MQRPRIKSIFPPIPLGDGRIRIGGGDYGIASELEDDEGGHTWHLLGLLDGSRTRTELIDAMQRFDRAVLPADVDAAIEALADAGFLEDAAPSPPPELTHREVERYRRNFEFFSYFLRPPLSPGEVQLRLRNSRVTVLGLGGLGSHVALSLAAIGVGDLLLVDHDSVELMNLNRQLLYTDDDIGRSKVEAAAERLAEVNPHLRVTAMTSTVDGVASARACMAGRDLIICAADRPRFVLYEWLNEAALSVGIPWIRGANDGLTVNLFLHVPYETACFRCVEQEAALTHPWYLPMQRYVVEVIGDQTINPCIAPVAGMIGNLAALEAVKHLTGLAPSVIHGRKLIVDIHTMETTFAEGHRLDDCSACGSRDAVAVPLPVPSEVGA